MPWHKRPFRVPLAVGRLPVLPLLAIASIALLLSHFDWQIYVAGGHCARCKRLGIRHPPVVSPIETNPELALPVDSSTARNPPPEQHNGSDRKNETDRYDDDQQRTQRLVVVAAHHENLI